VPGVPNTPLEVLDGVRGKVRGYLAGESVPLSVGGYVEEMIKRAVDEKNLCRMYIGWCAFF
jgi:serine/threonine-protein kinase ATR